MGYAPNRLASGLRNQRSHLLGFVSDRIASTPVAGEGIRGAQDAAYERGRLSMVVDSGKRAGGTPGEHVANTSVFVDSVVRLRWFAEVGQPCQAGAGGCEATGCVSGFNTAAAIAEQTHLLALNATIEAATGSSGIAQNITSVTTASQSTTAGAGEIQRAASDLACAIW